MTDFARPLRERDVDPDPFRQFDDWFRAAVEAGVREPIAAALATADASAAPSLRMVLVKQAGETGFVFYTNYASRKGLELAANPRAALLYHWDPLGRQVRIEGSVERLRAADSAAYVRSRARGSRLSALASPQSRPVASREALEQRVAELAQRYEHADLPIADDWGGFRLHPDSFEFWQHREDRLHDRLLYTAAGAGRWNLQRLAP
jgi:pyridoxamine 5'-phosphate oxidase